jgi:hypothetical protein
MMKRLATMIAIALAAAIVFSPHPAAAQTKTSMNGNIQSH